MLCTPLQSFLDGSSFLIIEGRESLFVLLLLTRRHAPCSPGRRQTGTGGQHLRFQSEKCDFFWAALKLFGGWGHKLRLEKADHQVREARPTVGLGREYISLLSLISLIDHRVGEIREKLCQRFFAQMTVRARSS